MQAIGGAAEAALLGDRHELPELSKIQAIILGPASVAVHDGDRQSLSPGRANGIGRIGGPARACADRSFRDGGTAMQPSLLEELTPVPNPYPIRSEIEYPEVWRLCEQARELAWDPATIDFSDLRDADLPGRGARGRRGMVEPARVDGAWRGPLWRRAAARGDLRHQPFEIKQHIINFIAEELRHHEASFLSRAGWPATRTSRAPTTSRR